MASAKPEITFYFDLISPFSYVMFEILQQNKHRLPARIVYKPVSLAGVFKTAKNTGPIANPFKARYVAETFPRLCKYWNLPFGAHVKMDGEFGAALFKHSTIKALRLCILVLQEQPHEFVRVARFFWQNLFVNLKFFESSNEITEVCKTLNLPLEYVDRIDTNEIKKVLVQNTETASKEGAFGVPFLVVRTAEHNVHRFFGAESFPQLCGLLNVKYQSPQTSKL